MAKTVLGVIGGSGVYDIAGLEHARWDRVVSPWGEPSDQLLFGRLAGVDMIFLPRHGRGHIHSPTTINYRANIDALKRAGATDLISVSACGSFREHLAPGTFAIVDQFIDRTHAREKSFFGKGFVAHVSMAHPICPKLADALVAMVTDFDCWHPDHDHVTVDQVIKVLTANADNARRLIARAAPKLGPERTPSPLGIEHVLDTAVITSYDKRDPALFEKLDAVAGRVLRKKF